MLGLKKKKQEFLSQIKKSHWRQWKENDYENFIYIKLDFMP